jgi:16S rRNA (uracil1498-N3)-methyltransferase
LLHYLGDSRPLGKRLLLEPEPGAHGTLGTLGAAVEIAIGPEGGFAAEELEAFRVCDFRPVRLGPRVLRAETAAIAAITWLQTRFGDFRPDENTAEPGSGSVSDYS